MSIAFFDLDRTLIPVNSAWLWMHYELRHDQLSYLQVAYASLWLTAYHLGVGSLDDALRRAIASYAGSSVEALRGRTRDFFMTELSGRYRPGALKALERHRAAGDQRVLLTTSSGYLSELVAEELSLDGFLCNRFEEDGRGVLTGRAVEPLVYGQGKVVVAARYAAERSVGLIDCTFYSDSRSDLPMLDAVGYPVVVHADPTLARLSKQRGWPQDDWGPL